MTQINLLPWREEVRKVKKIRFGILAGVFAGAALFFALITHLFMDALISSEQGVVDFLQIELNAIQSSVSNLNKSKKEQDELLSQVQKILTWREQSYQSVRLLDALPRIVPDSVKLTKIEKSGNQIKIEGLAQSNLQVTLLMEKITQAKIFGQPVLSEISEAKEPSLPGAKIFQLTVTEQEPEHHEES